MRRTMKVMLIVWTLVAFVATVVLCAITVMPDQGMYAIMDAATGEVRSAELVGGRYVDPQPNMGAALVVFVAGGVIWAIGALPMFMFWYMAQREEQS